MPEGLRVGIVGAGWPGQAHARGYQEAGGCKIVAVADLIPERRKKIMSEFGATREFSDAMELIADKQIDAISISLPNHLHASVAVAALKIGKHVLCEPPPCLNAKEARQIERAAVKSGKILLYALQRRFGGAETASKAAIVKGYAGDIYHARASWLRTRGVPIGTGWYTEKSKSGGGALVDVGLHMLDLAWFLLGQPKPMTVFGVGYQKFKAITDPKRVYDVEDSSFAIVKFEGGKSIELSSSWALNQPPLQQGTLCRMFGDQGSLDVYTPQGATIYRSFNAKGESKATPLKPPRTIGHTAMVRHFKDCIAGKAQPSCGVREGVTLMDLIDALYKSAESGKSVNL